LALNVISFASPVLVNNFGTTFGVMRGRQGPGSTRTSTLPDSDTASSPKPSSRQSFLGSRVGFTTTPPRRRAYGQPDLIAGRRPFNSLQNQFKYKAELEFANNECGRCPAIQRYQAQPQTSPLTSKPNPSRKRFTGE
jgi:hypothetical protein